MSTERYSIALDQEAWRDMCVLAAAPSLPVDALLYALWAVTLHLAEDESPASFEVIGPKGSVPLSIEVDSRLSFLAITQPLLDALPPSHVIWQPSRAQNSELCISVRGTLSFVGSLAGGPPPQTYVVDVYGGSEPRVASAFDASRVQVFEFRALVDTFVQLMREVTLAPQQRIRDCALISRPERHAIVETFNRTWQPIAPGLTLHGLFERQAVRTPDAIALRWDADTLTYRELNDASDRLAGVLRNHGAMVDEPVGILADRSPELVVGMLGTLRSGAPYLPLDPAMPQGRIDQIVTDSGVRLMLTQKTHQTRLNGSMTVLLLDDPLRPATMATEPRTCTPNDLAYTIYTSGSTGTPKGVMIEHASIVNRLLWMQRRFPLSADDVILQKTPIGFDVSVWELFWWQVAGASMYLLAPGQQKFPLAILEAVQQARVTVLHFVPSMLSVFLDYVRANRCNSALRSLRRVFVSGETLTNDLADDFHRLLGEPLAVQLINLYGPTEAAVDVTCHECTALAPQRIPIGQPIDNVRLYIAREGQLMPVGIPGTLYIGGVALARGYLGRSELTAERFAEQPFAPGERLYDTGDLARWLPDGSVEFLGRKDRQVKIRGVRIELDEIEHVFSNHVAVHECAVTINLSQPRLPQLSLFVVLSKPVTAAELRRHAAHYLPADLSPRSIWELPSLPHTAAGKIDRRHLARPDGSPACGTPLL